jgi:hypothetical protein
MLAFIIFVKELMEEGGEKDDKNNPCNAASK